MLKVKEMRKIRIAAPKNRMQRIIEALYNLKLVHLLDYKGREFFKIGAPLEGASHYSAYLVRVSSLISSIGIHGKAKKIENLQEALKKFDNLESKYLYLNNRISSLQQEKVELKQKLEYSQQFSELGLSVETLSGYKSIVSFVGTFKPKKNFEERLSAITENYELKVVGNSPRKSIALFVPRVKEDEIKTLLAENSFAEINLDLVSNVSELKQILSKIEGEQSQLLAELEKFKEENTQFLLDLEHTLDTELEKLEAPLRFATANNSFYLEGWIPAEDAERLQKELSTVADDKIVIEIFHEHEGAPVALQNPKIVQPFEFFMELYSLPKSHEVDPTFFLFLTFPLFFGFMLGDVGYGICTIVAALLLRNLFGKTWKKLMNVMVISGLTSLFFGFVFGEFFGFEFVEHPILNRMHDVNTMLMIAILIGAVHVNIGLAVGFYNKLMHHGLKHAILEKFSWFLLEAGALLIIFENMKILSIGGLGFYIGIAIILASIVMLFFGEGIKGIVELPGLASNIFSYARLFALGLASVALALIINDFAKNFFAAGGVMVVVAIIILILGHLINLAIGVLGCFLHSLRLHYVEFFNKFFEGGGVRYAPFGEEK